MNGKQGGDPAKLADALIKIASLDEPRSAGSPARMQSKPSGARAGT
jgi:hypothetical protein